MDSTMLHIRACFGEDAGGTKRCLNWNMVATSLMFAEKAIFSTVEARLNCY
jgi:hypothetical protein